MQFKSLFFFVFALYLFFFFLHNKVLKCFVCVTNVNVYVRMLFFWIFIRIRIKLCGLVELNTWMSKQYMKEKYEKKVCRETWLGCNKFMKLFALICWWFPNKISLKSIAELDSFYNFLLRSVEVYNPSFFFYCQMIFWESKLG